MNLTKKVLKKLEGKEINVKDILRSYTDVLEERGIAKVEEKVYQKQKDIIVFKKKDLEKALKEVEEELK